MAIANRDLDGSEQLKIYDYVNNALVSTGSTLYVGLAKGPATLQQVTVAANGISGTPTFNVEIHRFIVGAGLTVIAPGSAVTVGANYGTSGSFGGLAGGTFNSGSSLCLLQTNDLIVLKSGGANAAALQVVASVVCKTVQDIRSTFGQSS